METEFKTMRQDNTILGVRTLSVSVDKEMGEDLNPGPFYLS